MTIETTQNYDDSSRLVNEFHMICDTGGRLSGTASETAAVKLLKQLGQAATGVEARIETTEYQGWSAMLAELVCDDGQRWHINALVRSPSTPPDGIQAEVIDLGRGSPEEFAAHHDEIEGRIVLVRHELMFAPATIHRRKKIESAIEAGAVGFLIAGPAKDALVAGSAGRDQDARIPAAGISPEMATALARTSAGYPSVRLRILVQEYPAKAENLFFDLPGTSPEWVTLSAHIDGHDLGESAIDNASGLAVSLEVARRIASDTNSVRRGLRLAFFNVEEWALTGSAQHVSGLSHSETDAIALNVNLDSVAGGEHLTALTSDFPGVESFLLNCAEEVDIPLQLYRPTQMNSDHVNFAEAGVPAFRLVAGFGDQVASARYVLTPLDTRALVKDEELTRAARLAQEITSAALCASSEMVGGWRRN